MEYEVYNGPGNVVANGGADGEPEPPSSLSRLDSVINVVEIFSSAVVGFEPIYTGKTARSLSISFDSSAIFKKNNSARNP